jgi:hypothetical protein
MSNGNFVVLGLLKSKPDLKNKGDFLPMKQSYNIGPGLRQATEPNLVMMPPPCRFKPRRDRILKEEVTHDIDLEDFVPLALFRNQDRSAVRVGAGIVGRQIHLAELVQVYWTTVSALAPTPACACRAKVWPPVARIFSATGNTFSSLWLVSTTAASAWLSANGIVSPMPWERLLRSLLCQ